MTREQGFTPEEGSMVSPGLNYAVNMLVDFVTDDPRQFPYISKITAIKCLSGEITSIPLRLHDYYLNAFLDDTSFDHFKTFHFGASLRFYQAMYHIFPLDPLLHTLIGDLTFEQILNLPVESYPENIPNIDKYLDSHPFANYMPL
jgi:hypothetical protein